MFCPNCGKQNPEHANACAFCEHPLERPKPRFKGTMMMNAPLVNAPAQPTGAIGKPSDPPPPARSPKKTMVGGFAMPPGGIQPSAAPAPTNPEPAPVEPQPAPARSPKKTMIGGFAMPPGGPQPPSETVGSEPPAPAVAAASGAPSPKKTIIGGFTMPSGGIQPPTSEPPPPAEPASDAGATRSPKKTMIGGFAMPPGGIQASAAASEPEATEPASAAQASAPPASAHWDTGDEDTPASGLTLPPEEDLKRPSAAFDRTLVAGMISAQDLPPPPDKAEETAGADPSKGPEVNSATSDVLEPARKRSPVLLLLSATLVGVFALFIAYKTLMAGEANGELEIEQHRFALEGVVSAILLTCEADPSGAAALETIHLPADSPLKASICAFKPSAIQTIGDGDSFIGKRLSESAIAGFPGASDLDRDRCVVFRSGAAMIVTCDTEEIGITPVFFQNIDEL